MLLGQSGVVDGEVHTAAGLIRRYREERQARLLAAGTVETGGRRIWIWEASSGCGCG